MKRPAAKLVITALILFFGTFPGVSYAADPVPSTTPQNSGIPEATTSNVTVVPVVPTPAPASDTISIDFKDADINSVLRVLSMKSNVNIVTGPEVKGLVTVRLDNVPWEKALDAKCTFRGAGGGWGGLWLP